MEPWKHESQFGEFIAESSTFPTAPPSPQPDRKPNQPQKEDLEAFQRTINQLSKVEAHLKQNKEDPQLVQQLASFLKGARKGHRLTARQVAGPAPSMEQRDPHTVIWPTGHKYGGW